MKNYMRMPIAVVACVAMLAVTSCQTSKPSRLVVPEIRCAATPLRDAIAQVNAAALASDPKAIAPALSFDPSPARIACCGIGSLNSNAAARLIADYRNDYSAWTNTTHPITFQGRWTRLVTVAHIFANDSGGHVEATDTGFVIRYATKELELREYPHAGWHYAMNEDGNPENGRFYHRLVSGECGNDWPRSLYVAETDSLLVLGSPKDHQQLRKLIKELKREK